MPTPIGIEELYKIEDLGHIDHDEMLSLGVLHHKLNFIRKLYNAPMIINRGYSTPEEQIAIYQIKGLPPKMGSYHLTGSAADVADPNGKLKKWILDHLDLMEQLHLFCEDFDYTGGVNSGWVHIQTMPYLSWTVGKSIFFIP